MRIAVGRIGYRIPEEWDVSLPQSLDNPVRILKISGEFCTYKYEVGGLESCSEIEHVLKLFFFSGEQLCL